MKKSKVVIIGAGAAGLMAARVLHQNGIDFILLESTDRIGGRAQTLKGNPHVEYGPEYLHGQTPLTDSLMEEFKLPFYDLTFNYHLFANGKLKPLPDFWEKLCAVVGDIKAPRKDIPFDEYMNEYDQHSTQMQKITKMFIQGFDAADLNMISTKALSEMKDQVCDPKIRQMRRTLHGYGELMEHISRDFLPSIHFLHSVKEIAWDKGVVFIRGFHGKKPFEIQAEKVLNTVSVGVLKQQEITPMPKALEAFLNQVEMGQVVKLIGELDFEFFHLFENHAFPFVSSPDLYFSTWWPTSPIHTPLVTAWAGGEKARMFDHKSFEEKKAIYIEELAMVSGQSIQKIKGWVKHIHHYNWNSDPSFLGAYSYPKVLHEKKARVITSFDKTLYFAGEAFHEEMSGTIEGALTTGKDAAEKILLH